MLDGGECGSGGMWRKAPDLDLLGCAPLPEDGIGDLGLGRDRYQRRLRRSRHGDLP